MAESESENKRLAKNSLVLYIRMLVTMVIQLYTSRLVLQALGVEDYGIYNVVGGVVLLLNSINASLSNANARFIAVEIGRGNPDSMKRLFSCIMSIHYLFALLILIIAETLGLWFVMNKLVIPETRMTAAFWVYQSAVLSSIITIISSPYNGLIIAHEKMTAFAVISIFDSVAKLLIALSLFVSPFDRLIVYAILIVLIQLVERIIYAVYCKKKFQESKYKFIWDKGISKDVLSFAGWTLTGNVAVMGITQGLNILLNIFFGAVVNAARGIAVQVQGACRMFVSGFQTALNPQIIKTFSQNDFDRMHMLVNMSSRFSYYLTLLIALPICLNTQYILSLWLVKVPEYTAGFVQIMMAVSLISTLQNPTMTALHATGDIKTVQIVESLLLISVIPIAYIFLKWAHISPIMVFVIYLIIEFITQLVRVYMIYPKVYIRRRLYISKIILPITIVTILSAGACMSLNTFFKVANFPELIAISIAYIIITIIAIIVFGISRKERVYLINYVRSKIPTR